MSDQQIMINEPASNLATKFIDAEGVNIGASLLLRERTEIAGSGPNQRASVLALDPVSNDYGLVVRDVNTSAVVSKLTSTLNVQFDPGHTLGKVDAGVGTFQVFLPDTGHELGSIRGITNTIAVTEVTPSGATVSDSNFRAERVLIAGSHAAASLAVFPSTTAGTFQVYLPDTGHELGTIRGNTNTLTVYLPDTGHELGSIRQINSTVAVVPVTGSSVKLFDENFEAERVLIVGSSASSSIAVNGMVNIAATASIFTVSGSASGVSVSGNTIIAPSANYNFKVFAFALSTTAQSFLSPKFTNGAGTSPTEYWRYALQAPAQGIAGANLAVTPPGYIFATGTSTTLALVLDSASLVHYSVSYIKESA